MEYIEITFENIDYVRLPLSLFLHFSMQNIDTRIEMLERYFYPPLPSDDEEVASGRKPSKRLDKYFCVNDLSFSLPTNEKITTDFCKDDLFTRLADGDISQIDVIYNDGTVEKYFVPWSADEDYPYRNTLQKTEMTDTDSICVTINNTQNI